MIASDQSQSATTLNLSEEQMSPHPIFPHSYEPLEIPFNAFTCISGTHCTEQLVSYQLCDKAQYDESGVSSCTDSIEGVTITV